MKGIARRKASGREVEIWFQDEARVGQVGRTGRVWFERGQRPRGPRDMRRKAAWIFGAVCPARDTGDALVREYPEFRVGVSLMGMKETMDGPTEGTCDPGSLAGRIAGWP